jgi:hypothetical protein
MKVIITRDGYGIGHNWTLEYNKKQFFLGQDVKFCQRVLGFSPASIVKRIGTAEIDNDTIGNKKLAKFIVSNLGLTKSNTKNLNTWELCAQ